MTIAEFIKDKTDYTVDQLIDSALVIACRQAKKWRDEPGNNLEDWEHYNDLMEAFDALHHDRTGL